MTDAERTVTFTDLRTLARLPDTGVFEAKCMEEGLIHPRLAPLREMGDDIATWFDSSQGWRLTELDFSYCSPLRMAETYNTLFGRKPKDKGWFISPEEITTIARGHARFLGFAPKDGIPGTGGRKAEIDYLDLVFHFDAEKPPLTPGGRKLDLARVFSPDFKDVRREVRRKEGNVFVYPERVGPVYPLDRAQRELTSPYYLVAGRARVTSVVNRLWDFGSRYGEYNPKGSIAVLVFTEDLGDYLRDQEPQAGLVTQFDQRFPNTPLDQLAVLLRN